MTAGARRGTLRLNSLYPFLLVLLPVLHMAAAHPNQTSLDDIAVIVLTLVAGCLLIYAASALAGGRRWPGRLAPLATLLAVVWFYGYAKVAHKINQQLGTRHWMLVPLGLALSVGMAYWLLLHPEWLDRLARFLGITGLLLIAQFGVRIALSQWRARQELRHSHLIRRLSGLIPMRSGATLNGPFRDVYLIILDEYANSTVTRERFKTDNHEFEDALRRRGFVIPRVVRSNYMHTTLSLPSLLNATHLTELTNEVGSATSDPAVPNYLTEHNRTVAFLRARGYRFIFFPSQWWLSTRHNHEANLEFRQWPRPSARELSHTELRRNVREMSLLDVFQSDLSDDRDHVTRTLDGLRQVPRMGQGQPVFAFAHIMKPHHPFVFDAHCHTRRHHPAHRGGDSGYPVQLRCLNPMVLQLVDTLLANSAMPPVILIQGDHGTKTLGATSARSAARISPSAARERFGAFGAYYLPGGGAVEFGDTVTVVNVLGNVLRYYFGADLPRQPDDLYMSVSKALYDFQPADPVWLSGDTVSTLQQQHQ